MTLWIFGDCASRHYRLLPDTWVQRTGTHLKQKILSFAKPTSPPDHTIKKFNFAQDKFQKNDIVIITIPPLRHDYDWDEKYKRKPVEFYRKYLTFYDKINETYLINFMYNVNQITVKLNLHTIVLPNFYDSETVLNSYQKEFPTIHFPIGRFADISRDEFKPEFLHKVGVDWFVKRDVRPNHVTRTNGIEISNKMINNILHKTKIDLTTGYKIGFLDDKLMNDPEFIRDELFNGFMSKIRKEKMNNKDFIDEKLFGGIL